MFSQCCLSRQNLTCLSIIMLTSPPKGGWWVGDWRGGCTVGSWAKKKERKRNAPMHKLLSIHTSYLKSRYKRDNKTYTAYHTEYDFVTHLNREIIFLATGGIHCSCIRQSFMLIMILLCPDQRHTFVWAFVFAHEEGRGERVQIHPSPYATTTKKKTSMFTCSHSYIHLKTRL